MGLMDEVEALKFINERKQVEYDCLEKENY